MLYVIFSRNTAWKSELGRTLTVDEGLIKTCRNAGCGAVMLSRAGLRPCHRSDGCLGKQVALLPLSSGPLTLLPTWRWCVEGGLRTPTCPQSPPPSSECGPAWVLSNPGTLGQLPSCLSREWTHPPWEWGWWDMGSVIVSESRTSSADRWAWGSAAVSWPWLQRRTLALLRPTLQNPSPGANWHHLKCLCGTERWTKGGGPWGFWWLSVL